MSGSRSRQVWGKALRFVTKFKEDEKRENRLRKRRKKRKRNVKERRERNVKEKAEKIFCRY